MKRGNRPDVELSSPLDARHAAPEADHHVARIPAPEELPDSSYWYVPSILDGHNGFVLHALGDFEQARQAAREALSNNAGSLAPRRVGSGAPKARGMGNRPDLDAGRPRTRLNSGSTDQQPNSFTPSDPLRGAFVCARSVTNAEEPPDRNQRARATLYPPRVQRAVLSLARNRLPSTRTPGSAWVGLQVLATVHSRADPG
ncbi:hypothetical protein GCM10027444_39250 [Actinopolyspora lacussalsi]